MLACHRERILYIGIIAVLFSSCSLKTDPPPSEFHVGKTLGSIVNNDINNILWALSGKATTPREYKNTVLHLLDAQPGVLAQNVGLPDPVIYRTKVATTFDKYLNQAYKGYLDPKDTQAACMRALLDAGTDPLSITIKACRSRRIKIVASYRMNSRDFHEGQLDMSDFGRQHKGPMGIVQYAKGAHCVQNMGPLVNLPYGQASYALDPADPRVYAHYLAIFTEVAFQYDIDGIEFDFQRTPPLISNPRENHRIFTQMVRETRRMLDFVAKKKGRERLLLGVRVPPTVDGPYRPGITSCKELGVDIKTWVKEGAVDYICPSFFLGFIPDNIPQTSEFVKLTQGTKVGVYPTVFPDTRWLKNKQGEIIKPIETTDIQSLRRYRDDIITFALKAYEEGADGISTFNWFPHEQPGFVRKIMEEDYGLGPAKMQMVLLPRLKDRNALEETLHAEVSLEAPMKKTK